MENWSNWKFTTSIAFKFFLRPTSCCIYICFHLYSSVQRAKIKFRLFLTPGLTAVWRLFCYSLLYCLQFTSANVRFLLSQQRWGSCNYMQKKVACMLRFEYQDYNLLTLVMNWVCDCSAAWHKAIMFDARPRHLCGATNIVWKLFFALARVCFGNVIILLSKKNNK